MATPTRHFRIPDEDWQTALTAVEARGETISGVLRGMLADYVAGNLPGYMSGFVAGVEAARIQAADTARQKVVDAVGAALGDRV